MAQIVFLALAILSFSYWLLCGIRFSFRASILYFWPLLTLAHSLFALFPPVRHLLLIPYGLFWLLFFLFLVLVEGQKGERAEDFDLILVLGCRCDKTFPGCILEKRLRGAIDAHRKNPDAPLLLSGGRVFGEEMSEAEVMRLRLIEQGIPAETILTEEKSRTTKENFTHAFSRIPKNTKKALVITSAYHLARARLTAKASHPPCPLTFLGTAAPPLFLPHLYLREFFTFFVDLILGNLTMPKGGKQ